MNQSTFVCQIASNRREPCNLPRGARSVGCILNAGPHNELAPKKSWKPSSLCLDQTVSTRFPHPPEGSFRCILRHPVATSDTPLVHTITSIFEK